MNDTNTADDGNSSTDTYKVPLIGHGTIYVEAGGPKSAVKAAKNNSTSDDLRAEFDVNHAQVFDVRAIDNYSGTPANAEDTSSDSQGVTVPDVPSPLDFRETREELDLTLDDVAKELGVGARTVSRWEREESPMSHEQAQNYSEVLKELQEDT